jgi:hypothetical protein
LHPDFSNELASVVEKWDAAQKVRVFSGVRPRREDEVRLLTKGAIPLEEAFKIAARIRNDAGYSPDDGIIVFTEKRIHSHPYYQLFFGGTSSTDTPPNVVSISLDFTRSLFATSSQNSQFVFQIILSNILSALAQDEGLSTHDDTRGCILDFCNNMPDIIKGIESGFTFCAEHSAQVKKQKKDYLFMLSRVVSDMTLTKDDTTIASKRILSLNKPRLEDDESEFDYDVALSFAGEDRTYAEQLARSLRDSGVKVFYDTFEKAKLWGEDLYVYLSDLYKLRAKYCIMFLSQHYASKLWTSHERKAAQSRAFKESRAYILPVRIDDTEIPGILDTVGYLNWRDEGANGVAQCLLQKLQL